MIGSLSMRGQRANELPLNRPAATFQHYVLDDHNVQPKGLGKTNKEAATPADCWTNQSKVFPQLTNGLKLIAISAFGLLLAFILLSVCPAVKYNVAEGMHRRRLAEGGGQDNGDFSPPSTPELVNLCLEAEGELGPGEASSLRESPLMVNAYFEALAEGEGPVPEAAAPSPEKSAAPPSSSFSKKSPAAKGVKDAGHFGAQAYLSADELSPQPFRASPLMVEAFFAGLKGYAGPNAGLKPTDLSSSSLEESGTPSISSISKKRPASGADDGEIRGSRWKVAKKDTPPAPLVSSAIPETKEPSQVSDGDFVAAGISRNLLPSINPGSPESQDLLEFLESTLEHSELSLVSPSGDEGVLPSSAEAPVAASGQPGDGGTLHPWLHVPALEPGVRTRPFSPQRMASSATYHRQADLLNNVRKLLLQPMLNQADASGLLTYAECLVAHALRKMTAPVTSRRPTDAAEGLARRFLLFHVLHLTSKALHQAWSHEQWWKDLANAIPTNCPYRSRQPLTSASERSVRLASELSAALKLYKSGSAPRDEEVVAIMRKIFCSDESPHHFKRSAWDPWRDDDKSSSPPS